MAVHVGLKAGFQYRQKLCKHICRLPSQPGKSGNSIFLGMLVTVHGIISLLHHNLHSDRHPARLKPGLKYQAIRLVSVPTIKIHPHQTGNRCSGEETRSG